MYQEKGFKTIFDDVKAKPIYSATIKEDEVIKPNKTFSVNNDKFDFSLIVDEYKIPSFKYIDDNSINDFYDFPDVTMSQNPEYKYKYPNLSKAETIKQQWQTEEGTPNELNRFLRHNDNGGSLEFIQEQDNAYQQGLVELQKMIDNSVKNEDKQARREERPSFKEEIIQEGKDMTRLRKRYNPVTIKPALLNEKVVKRFNREVKLFNDIKDIEDHTHLKKVPDEPKSRHNRLINEIKGGKQLKSINRASPPPIASRPPSSDLPTDALPDDDITPDKLNEAKSKLKHTKTNKELKKEELDNNKKARYETLNKQYNNESKKIVSQEKLVLKGYDEVLNKLGNITSKRLTVGERKEINQMLKDIDGSNIGAIALKQSAINKLLTKKELIESKKNEINAKRKAETVERKAPRRVSKNFNVMDLSTLPANDDESDFSVKKVVKSSPVKSKYNLI